LIPAGTSAGPARSRLAQYGGTLGVGDVVVADAPHRCLAPRGSAPPVGGRALVRVVPRACGPGRSRSTCGERGGLRQTGNHVLGKRTRSATRVHQRMVTRSRTTCAPSRARSPRRGVCRSARVTADGRGIVPEVTQRILHRPGLELGTNAWCRSHRDRARRRSRCTVETSPGNAKSPRHRGADAAATAGVQAERRPRWSARML